MKKITYLFVFGGLLFLTACGAAAAPMDSNTDNPPLSTPPPADVANEPDQPAAGSSPAEQKMINISLESLSRKLNVDTAQIKINKITKVTWRDASLGCPKPGVDYMRVETPGYSIILEVEGKTYEYHTDESKRATLCNSAQPKGVNPIPRWKV